MKIIMLQDELFAYLQHVVRSHAAGGIEPEEGMAIFQLNLAIKGAQTVDETRIESTPPSGDDPLDINKP